MTLWELAQSWEHDNTGTVFEPLHAPEICRRCQIEQWARERAKHHRALRDQGPSPAAHAIFLADLGVPEESSKKP